MNQTTVIAINFLEKTHKCACS